MLAMLYIIKGALCMTTQCRAKASLLVSVCEIWSCVSAERRDRKLPWSCGVTLRAHVRRSELCTQWAIVKVCEVTQNELYCIVGTHFRFASITLISLQVTSGGHPLFVKALVLIWLLLQKASSCCLCAALIRHLIMSPCVQFPPGWFEFALIWRGRYWRLLAARCFLNVRLQLRNGALLKHANGTNCGSWR